MVINVDISSAAFYKGGPLIRVCLEYMGRSPDADPVQFLSGARLDVRTRKDLLKFIRNLNVRTARKDETRVRSIKDISDKGADAITFTPEGGGTISVKVGLLARFVFSDILILLFSGMVPSRDWTSTALPDPRLRARKYPFCVGYLNDDLIAAILQLGKSAMMPMELCEVVPGQFYRKTLTPDQTKHMVEFSTLKPHARLQNIRQGLQVRDHLRRRRGFLMLTSLSNTSNSATATVTTCKTSVSMSKPTL